MKGKDRPGLCVGRRSPAACWGQERQDPQKGVRAGARRIRLRAKQEPDDLREAVVGKRA